MFYFFFFSFLSTLLTVLLCLRFSFCLQNNFDLFFALFSPPAHSLSRCIHLFSGEFIYIKLSIKKERQQQRQQSRAATTEAVFMCICIYNYCTCVLRSALCAIVGRGGAAVFGGVFRNTRQAERQTDSRTEGYINFQVGGGNIINYAAWRGNKRKWLPQLLKTLTNFSFSLSLSCRCGSRTDVPSGASASEMQ